MMDPKLYTYNSELARLLECPVCLQLMNAPIEMCINSHSICHRCRQKIDKCPTCSQPFSATRNLIAEQFSDMVLHRCSNYTAGCTEMVSKKDLQRHERFCEYRLYECLLGKNAGCIWIGQRKDMFDHARSSHRSYACLTEANSTWFLDTDLRIFADTTVLMLAHEELFLYSTKQDPEKKRVFFCMQYVGPEDNADNFRYEVRLCTRDGKFKVDFCRPTHCHVADLDTIIESGECIDVGYGIIKQLATNCPWTIEVNILKRILSTKCLRPQL